MLVATRYAIEIRTSSNVCRYSIWTHQKVEFKVFYTPFVRMDFVYYKR